MAKDDIHTMLRSRKPWRETNVLNRCDGPIQGIWASRSFGLLVSSVLHVPNIALVTNAMLYDDHRDVNMAAYVS